MYLPSHHRQSQNVYNGTVIAIETWSNPAACRQTHPASCSTPRSRLSSISLLSGPERQNSSHSAALTHRQADRTVINCRLPMFGQRPETSTLDHSEMVNSHQYHMTDIWHSFKNSSPMQTWSRATDRQRYRDKQTTHTDKQRQCVCVFVFLSLEGQFNWRSI